MRTSHKLATKRPAPSNPLLLSARSGLWLYWILVGIVMFMVVGAAYWLLTQGGAAR